jgi:hypothetical protein
VAQRGRGLIDRLTRQQLKNRIFCYVVGPQAAINGFIEKYRQSFWKAGPDHLIVAIQARAPNVEIIHWPIVCGGRDRLSEHI